MNWHQALLALILGLIGGLIFGPLFAHAHSWYAPNCCAGQDCEPIPFEAVTEMQNGWEVDYKSTRGFTVSHFVPRGEQRQSQDGRFHACATSTQFLCFYVPVNA